VLSTYGLKWPKRANAVLTPAPIRATDSCGVTHSAHGHAGAEVADRDDNRHTAGDVSQAEVRESHALPVIKRELFGVVGKDADAIDALVDHAIEHPLLTRKIQIAAFGDGRDNGENAGITSHCCACADGGGRSLDNIIVRERT
jgi:hypothetical protein